MVHSTNPEVARAQINYELVRKTEGTVRERLANVYDEKMIDLGSCQYEEIGQDLANFLAYRKDYMLAHSNSTNSGAFENLIMGSTNKPKMSISRDSHDVGIRTEIFANWVNWEVEIERDNVLDEEFDPSCLAVFFMWARQASWDLWSASRDAIKIAFQHYHSETLNSNDSQNAAIQLMALLSYGHITQTEILIAFAGFDT